VVLLKRRDSERMAAQAFLGSAGRELKKLPQANSTGDVFHHKRRRSLQDHLMLQAARNGQELSWFNGGVMDDAKQSRGRR
jgi:hypothetical protein